MKPNSPAVIIAHRVLVHETFDKAAQTLLRLLHGAQLQSPDAERILYLDIDGHTNPSGGFDDDMYELQTKFMAEILMKFLTRAETPLGEYRNPLPQDNNIPSILNLIKMDGSHTA
jgi:hypothetical protein